MKYVPKYIRVSLNEEEMLALGKSAEEENREPRAQAAQLIKEGLQARGYLGNEASVVVIMPGVKRDTARAMQNIESLVGE